MNQIKSIYNNYFILITICIFVILYYVMNYKKAIEYNFNMNDAMKPAILTVIIVLVLYLFYGCEDNSVNSVNSNKTYRIVNKYNQQPMSTIPQIIPIPSQTPVNQQLQKSSTLDENVFMPQSKAMRMGLNI